jgi:hypothetical protein
LLLAACEVALRNKVLPLPGVLAVVEKKEPCHTVATEAETSSPLQPASLELLFEPCLSCPESRRRGKLLDHPLQVPDGIGLTVQRVIM